MERVLFTPFGVQANALLRERITAAKGGDALAPVTVVVPSNYAGLSLRRVLGKQGGLVNVRFMVLARVAELLGAPLLAKEGRRPLTRAIRREAVRAALDARPGFFGPVAGHAATGRSLEAVFRDLRRAPDDALVRLTQSGERAADVVSIYRRFRALTHAFYDPTDLADAGASAVRAESAALRDLGLVVVFLPRDMAPADMRLIEALAERGAAEVLLGVANDRQADEVTARLARALGAPFERGHASHHLEPGDTEIAAVTDPEEEVRTVLRMIAEALASGASHVPLHRMGVVYREQAPYALLTHEQFKAAGVPHNGPGITTLAQSMAGAALTGILRLREASFRRDAVMDWLTLAPIRKTRDAAELAPAQLWNRLSRAAGVTSGAEQWAPRLEHYARSVEMRAERIRIEDDDQRAQSYLQRAVQPRELGAFIDELRTESAPPDTGTWASFAGWCRGLLDRYLGNELRFPGHDDHDPQHIVDLDAERKAFDDVKAIVDELGTLDQIAVGGGPRVTEAVFRQALDAALEAGRGARLGKFGDGVFIGRIADAVGMEFDLLFVLGMVEGQMPPVGHEDPLLPDEERRLLGDVLPLRGARREEERRDYLAALAAARRRVLLFPRADLRGQSENLPARWLLEAASDLASAAAGAPQAVFTREFAQLQEAAGSAHGNVPWLTSLASFTAAVEKTRYPASEQEYDLRSLVVAREPLRHFRVTSQPQLAHGVAAIQARTGYDVTEWDGLLLRDTGRTPSAQHPSSPTGLETWARCPFNYLLRTVLHVAETEHPEETLSINPADRGTLMHQALQTFFNTVRGRSGRDDPWTSEEHAQLRTIAEGACRQAQEAGLTGKPLLWAIERRRILRDLDLFLDAEQKRRQKDGYIFDRAEFTFGMNGQPPLIVTLPGERSVAFRGSIDRVDHSDDGRIAVVDYKTGRAEKYQHIGADPVLHGELLQLPVYGLAAAAAFNVPKVDAQYWFITEQQDYQMAGYEVAAGEPPAFTEALGAIVEGIEEGVFPARSGKWGDHFHSFENCRFCPYDSLCARDRDRAWKRKRQASAIETYTNLLPPEGDDDD